MPKQWKSSKSDLETKRLSFRDMEILLDVEAVELDKNLHGLRRLYDCGIICG